MPGDSSRQGSGGLKDSHPRSKNLARKPEREGKSKSAASSSSAPPPQEAGNSRPSFISPHVIEITMSDFWCHVIKYDPENQPAFFIRRDINYPYNAFFSIVTNSEESAHKFNQAIHAFVEASRSIEVLMDNKIYMYKPYFSQSGVILMLETRYSPKFIEGIHIRLDFEFQVKKPHPSRENSHQSQQTSASQGDPRTRTHLSSRPHDINSAELYQKPQFFPAPRSTSTFLPPPTAIRPPPWTYPPHPNFQVTHLRSEQLHLSPYQIPIHRRSVPIPHQDLHTLEDGIASSVITSILRQRGFKNFLKGPDKLENGTFHVALEAKPALFSYWMEDTSLFPNTLHAFDGISSYSIMNAVVKNVNKTIHGQTSVKLKIRWKVNNFPWHLSEAEKAGLELESTKNTNLQLIIVHDTQ